MAHIIYTLFPVFVVIALGFGLAKSTFLSKGFLDDLNKFVYYVCLPALMLGTLASAEELPPGTLPVWLVYISASGCVLALSVLTAKLLGLKRWQFGTFIQAAFRGNIAFIGIPILVYALRDQDKETAASVLAQAVFVFAPTMVFYNVLSVIVLVASRESNLMANLPRALVSIAKNPLVIAALAGMALFALPFDVPVPLVNTLDYIGRVAGPAALICVGGGMAHVSMEGRYRSATFTSLLKVAGVPLFAWLLARPFGFSDSTLLILMVFSATPTAVASYVMAKELHGDEAMASGGIVMSTLFSVISLAVIVGLFSA